MRPHVLLLGVALTAFGCGGGDAPATTEPTDNGAPGTATNGTFTADLNGVTWNAQGTVAVNRSTNFIGLGAAGLNTAGAQYSLVLSFGNASATGTYSLTYLNQAGSSLIVGTPTLGWGTDFTGGTGTATITTLTSNRVAGTFTADVVPSTGRTTGTVQVRNGRFDVRF
jgi:hypothetical protein